MAWPPPVIQADFREALSCWPSGVTVVTTRDHHRRPWGFTATSFTGLSVDPPLILVCLDRSAACSAAFASAPGFAVHILGREQAPLAHHFARKSPDKFVSIPISAGIGGLPLLDDVVALLECNLVDRLAGGDHIVLIGEVQRLRSGRGDPLVYYRRGFRDLRTAGTEGHNQERGMR